jgi:hypothetical protein
VSVIQFRESGVPLPNNSAAVSAPSTPGWRRPRAVFPSLMMDSGIASHLNPQSR